jgi:hypothetical protein
MGTAVADECAERIPGPCLLHWGPVSILRRVVPAASRRGNAGTCPSPEYVGQLRTLREPKPSCLLFGVPDESDESCDRSDPSMRRVRSVRECDRAF